MQTKWKKIIKRGEILPSMAPLPAIFFKVDSICQQFIAKIHEHTRRHHNPSSHVHISGRKRKKKTVKHISGISGILERKWFEIGISNNYPVFLSNRRNNVSFALKRKPLPTST